MDAVFCMGACAASIQGLELMVKQVDIGDEAVKKGAGPRRGGAFLADVRLRP